MRRIVGFAIVVIGAAGLAAAVTWLTVRPTAPRVVRATISPAATAALSVSFADRDLAITPDGSRLVYVGNNGNELFLRPLDSLDSVSLYKGSPRGVFVSPDGQWVGFIDNAGAITLKKIAITGGPAVTVATLDGTSRGAVWLPDDTIVFASTSASGLQQVSAGGGPVTVITRPDRTRGELDHVWPEALPGGRALLFTISPQTGGPDAAQIAVLDLRTHAQTVVVRGGSDAHYVASGHLVYVAAGSVPGAEASVRAIGFDPVNLTTRGTPVPVVPQVVATLGTPAPGGDVVVAGDGTLVYVQGIGAIVPRVLSLVWVDRQGRETQFTAPPRAYLYPRISPDGSRVVVYTNDQEFDLWVWDVIRLTLTRLTFARGLDTYPVWSPNGRRLLFGSDREGARNLFAQAADGTGAAERLTTSLNTQNPTAVTPDGTRLIFTEIAPQTNEDVMQVTVTGTHTVTSLVNTPAAERNGIVSPDGRWLAYEANDSGSFEIYVRPYPDVSSGHWQVSNGGGTRPLWSPNGQELFYVSPTGAIMRVGVDRAASWAATPPTLLLKDAPVLASAFTPLANPGRTYDVSPDGGRFLLVKPPSAPNVPPPQMVVVQHFDQELKRLVPTK
jgi:serine/threonine-protein kinase